MRIHIVESYCSLRQSGGLDRSELSQTPRRCSRTVVHDAPTESGSTQLTKTHPRSMLSSRAPRMSRLSRNPYACRRASVTSGDTKPDTAVTTNRRPTAVPRYLTKCRATMVNGSTSAHARPSPVGGKEGGSSQKSDLGAVTAVTLIMHHAEDTLQTRSEVFLVWRSCNIGHTKTVSRHA